MTIIGIDASRTSGRVRTGTENYSLQIIRALLAEDLPFDWRLYFNGLDRQADWGSQAAVDIRDIPAPRLWTHGRLAWELMRNRPDGLFVPAHVIPLIHPPSVVTIHDLGYLHVPEAHPRQQRVMLDATTRWSAAVARHIIVPSQHTRDDLEQRYRVSPDKITVIHHGIGPGMSPEPTSADADLRERYRLPERFVLAVGTIQPRKNLPLLARAMAPVMREQDVELVIAGQPGWMFDHVQAELEQAHIGERLHILNYIPDEDLSALYRAATLVAQPSRFEGFGMPVLEAMACGTPVVTANSSALKEVGGTAAIGLDADDESAWTSVLQELLDSPDRLAEQSRQGLDWARSFSWERAGRETRQVLETYLV